MNFKLIKIEEEKESNFEVSKIGGSPCFPIGFLQQHHLMEDLFVAQLNLEELQIPQLPKQGFLYFFLNVDAFPYQAKVVYTAERVAEVYDLINEDFDEYGNPAPYQICPTEEDFGMGICREFDANLDLDCVVTTQNACNLLEFDTLNLPSDVLTLGQPNGWYLFVIDKDDLANLDFSDVQFLSYGS